MTTDRLARLIERDEIHRAACRYRKAGLACSTCGDFAEIAGRARAALAAQTAQAA